MNHHFDISHVGQIMEITYNEPGWGNSLRMAGRLEGFHDNGTTVEWWMADRSAKADKAHCSIRTLQASTDEWMQPCQDSTSEKESA